jgi:hypothetical protein
VLKFVNFRFAYSPPSRRLSVSHVVNVPISIGEYNDNVECDVVPMQACQLLLGGPWLYDRDS